MRFAKELVDMATEFRLKFLESSDDEDGTLFVRDWRDAKVVSSLPI